MIEEKNLKLKGTFMATLKHPNGNIETLRKDNLILNVGFDFIADAIGKASGRPGVMSHTAVGTGSDAVASSQTALVTELARKAATYAHTAGTKVFTFSTYFAAGEATGAITEAGICNASSGGTFIDRVTFAVINKGADDELTVNFQFTLS
nr:MAG TPA: hypothetical protein [Caudoviricetes sp.]